MKAIVLELRVKSHGSGLDPWATLSVLFYAKKANPDIKTRIKQSEALDYLDRYIMRSSGYRYY
jgi:hypothetical protein